MNFICSICSQSRGIPERSYRGYKLYRCQNCCHVQLFPVPLPDAISDHYQTSGDGLDNNFGFRNLEDYVQNPDATAFFKKRIFSDFVNCSLLADRTASILEIGCSTGTDLAVLCDQYGFSSLAGIEINEHLAKKGRELLDLDIRTGSFSKELMKDKQPFDAAFALHVIEHTTDPLEFLRESAQVLRPGGILFLNLPNYDSISRILLGRDWQWLMVPGHIHYFCRNSLKIALESAGFTNIRIYSEQNFFPGGYVADLVRIIKRVLRMKKQEPSTVLPSFSHYYAKRKLLLTADIAVRILTFPLWAAMRLLCRGSCLIAIAKKKSE